MKYDRQAAFCLYVAITVLLVPAWSPAYANPRNSHIVSGGAGWRCDSGYRRTATGCQKIGAVPQPANSAGQGTHWYCKSGYRKVGNQCHKVDLPANSHNSGGQWACQAGYYRQGDRCEKLDTPATITAPPVRDSIEAEDCSGGYILVDGICRMNVPDSPRR